MVFEPNLHDLLVSYSYVLTLRYLSPRSSRLSLSHFQSLDVCSCAVPSSRPSTHSSAQVFYGLTVVLSLLLVSCEMIAVAVEVAEVFE